MRLVPSIALALVAAYAAGGLTSCQSAPDKRLLQYLNQKGFGKHYTGNAEEEDYVTIGDRISYIDAFQPGLQGTDGIALDGTITLPEVGAVHVAGMTRSEIEAILQQKFAPYFERTDITVVIQSGGNKFYWVLGEVQGKGPKPFKGDTTIFEAVMLSGPFQNTANLGRVKLVRPDPREPFTMTVNVNDMVRFGDTTYNVHVQENDIIFVPPTMLAQVGYFIVALITPVTTVINAISSSLGRYFGFGYAGRGRGQNNNFNNNSFF